VSQPTVGLIGLGLMGLPMGHNLLKAGFPLVVWNRTASRADSLVAAGAKRAASPHEVAAASDVLLTIVSDPPALEEVLWNSGDKSAFPALKKGAIYIDSSTVSPTLARKIAAASATAGIRFLDAPVTGGTTVHRAVDLSTMPIYVRAGAILPLDTVRQYTGEPLQTPTTLRIYPGANGNFILYDDDGISLDYLRGKAVWIRLRWDDATRILHVSPGAPAGVVNRPLHQTFRVRLMTGGREVTVKYAGKDVSAQL